MRTIAVVQSRLSSSRFPQKALADLHGHSLVWHVVTRAMQIPGVGQIVLAVPFGDMLVFAHALDVRSVHDGWASLPSPGMCFVPVTIAADKDVPEGDVLGRFLSVARNCDADVVMRLTADCPVLNPVVAGQVLELYHASPACDFASNDTLISGYPDGWDVAVFSRAALETAAAQATDPADREHIECWMKRPENGLRCRTLMAPEPWTGPTKLSIDMPADLETVRQWLERQVLHG